MNSRPGRALAAAVITVAVFATTIGAPLTFDDRFIVELHPVVNGSLAPLEAFAHGWWDGVAGAKGNEYRPLSTLLLALEVRATGGAPWALRCCGMALHLALCFVIFRLGRRLGLGDRGSEIAAGLFALHPVHVEVVGSVVGQAEMLQCLLVGIALLCFLSPGRGNALAWPVALGAALLSKESAIVAPVLVAGTAAWLSAASRSDPQVEAPARRPGLALLAYTALPAYGWARVAVLGAFTGQRSVSFVENPLVDASHLERLLAAPVLLAHYARLLLFPVQLSADYSHDSLPLPGSPMDLAFVGSTSLLLGAAVLAWRRRSAPWAFGLGWFVVSLAIASNLLFPIGTIFGERLVYMASIGAVLAAGVGLARLLERRPRAAAVGIAAILVLFAVRVVERGSDFLSEERLFAAAVQQHPRNVKARYNYAVALDGRGDLEGVREQLDRALEVLPTYRDARIARAQLRALQGEPEAARTDLLSALDDDPDSVDVRFALADLALRRGDCGAARRWLEEVEELAPGQTGDAFPLPCAGAEESLARPGGGG